ncbi:MAG: hypothetical protein Q4C58_00595 [Eubacteriales bacterium]|nr:hypothetical protein [Eubacteriales bacterium]
MKEKRETTFVGYEYKEMTIPKEQASMYMDCYENFGWEADENIAAVEGRSLITVRMKRNRKMINKMELTRLQRHFEACAKEVEALERSKTSAATAWAIVTGIIGTAFMAGSTFAVVHEPPVIWLCILLAIPGFIGWILPYFIYNGIVRKSIQRIQPLIEAKYEEIYEICEKGNKLL